MEKTKFSRIESSSKLEKVQTFESNLLVISFISFLGIATVWRMGGLLRLVGILILVDCYIYAVDRRVGEGDEFWARMSKPAMAGLLILSLLLFFEHFHIF